MTFLVRTPRDPLSLVAPVRRIMKGLAIHCHSGCAHHADGARRDLRARTLQRAPADRILALRAPARGHRIYGVLAYSVSERTREIGVRLAIGAGANRIVGMVLQDGARFIAVGLAIGIAGALGLSRLIRVSCSKPRPPTGGVPRQRGILVAVALVARMCPPGEPPGWIRYQPCASSNFRAVSGASRMPFR